MILGMLSKVIEFYSKNGNQRSANKHNINLPPLPLQTFDIICISQLNVYGVVDIVSSSTTKRNYQQ
jgi:hypothetical protein